MRLRYWIFGAIAIAVLFITLLFPEAPQHSGARGFRPHHGITMEQLSVYVGLFSGGVQILIWLAGILRWMFGFR